MTDTSGAFPRLQIPDAARDAYQAGRAAMRDHQYETAVSHFTQVLAAAGLPDIFRARTLEYRARCHWLLSAFAQAEDDYRASLAASDDPNQTARARVGLGEVTDFQGDYEKSEQIYQQALQEGTAVNDVMVIGRARRGLGILNRRGGNTGRALDHLTQALAAFRQAGEAR
jgi:tetratricopeptide (TPR) repeat protein